MQKKRYAVFVLGLFLISLVSAYYGSYSSFSLTDLLDSIDSSTMILGAVFIISFAFVNFALVRVFKDNKATAGIVAFVVSLLITWGINRTGFDFESLFYNIGFSEGLLYTILPFVLLAGAIYLGIKFGFRIILIVLGGLLILVSFTELVYEKGATLIIGVVLIVIGFWLSRGRRPSIGNSYDYAKSKYRDVRDWSDPRSRFGRYTKRREESKEKHLARRALKEQKSHDRAWLRANALGKKSNIDNLSMENPDLDKKQKQSAIINNEILRLQKIIPNVSVMERGKIEDEIKRLKKQIRKL